MKYLYTIGHSNYDAETFIELLRTHKINAVCDVRSSPYSRYTPQFNYETIKQRLKIEGIEYVYLGKELGPRSDDPDCYEDGKVEYKRLAQTDIFQEGLKRVNNGVQSFRIALMCAEKDPVTCHRTILVCRHLRSADLEILHILEDGSLENNRDLERRLMRMLKIPEQTLFDRPEDLVEQAYNEQGKRIAYKISDDNENGIGN